jgi:integrase
MAVQYEREEVRFTEQRVQSAISYSQSKQITGKLAEWRDAKTVGLTLRITPRNAVWYVRRRDLSLRIGAATEIKLETARYIADQTRHAAKRKRDLRVFVEYLVAAQSRKATADYQDQDAFIVEGAYQFADDNSNWGRRRLTGDSGPSWTWTAMRHHFLAYKLSTLRPNYRVQYEHFLKLPEFAPLEQKLVVELRLRDLEPVRDALARNHAPSMVHRAISQAKHMLNWALEDNSTRAGFDETSTDWWNKRWKFVYKANTRSRTPTLDEVARTLMLAEHLATQGDDGPLPGTLAALWAVALTAQRTGSLFLLLTDGLFDPPKNEKRLKGGWKVASWTKEEMKGGRDGGRAHMLPIPPNALRILRDLHAKADDKSPWMFPARDPSKRLTAGVLNNLIYRMQGRVYDHTVRRKKDRPGKPGPKPLPRIEPDNLFEKFKIRPWSPHDVRRTLTGYLLGKRLGGAATAILGHKLQNAIADERQKIAAVTDTHYNTGENIDLMAEGMKLWVDALLAAYAREKKRFRPMPDGRSGPALARSSGTSKVRYARKAA